ncbi:MAG: EAL domain-containing protein [Hallerella porci]|uniref:EAL domain-containing protein n=1 Tax=Hallerella porci TaxID=1945871 RepID=UPI002A830EE2|nr:EAL domain-containing protein [Hallerella porci]MDY3920825.1 EAL domain-containing protein [Hallerella porci]
MLTVYFVGILIFLGVMNWMAFGVVKRKSVVLKTLWNVVLFINLVVISSVLSTFIPNHFAAVFSRSVHYITTQWMLFYVLLFFERYTKKSEDYKYVRRITFVVSIINSVSLLLNPFFGHIVIGEWTQSISGMSFWEFINVKPGYYIFHFIYITILSLFIFLSLIHRVVIASQHTRMKYMTTLVLISSSILLEVIASYRSEHLYDYPLFAYMLSMILIIYYALCYVTKSVVEKTLTQIMLETDIGTVCFDAEEKCIYANDAMKKIYGEKMKLNDYEEICKTDLFGVSLNKQIEKSFEKEVVTPLGKRYFDVSFRKLKDEHGNDIGCYFLYQDKTAFMKKALDDCYRLTHDEITGFYNRRRFIEIVDKNHRRHRDDEYYIVCTDIKDFKLLNDLFDRITGNDVLRRMSEIFAEIMPKSAVCARLQSDRFAFYLKKDEFNRLKYLNAIGTISKLLAEKDYQILVHTGIYETKGCEESASTMCDRAHMAISLIKEDYNKKISFYDKKFLVTALREKRYTSEFEVALSKRQFKMYLQAQVTPNGNVCGAEALVRWIHPESGLIPPYEFISVFEKSGLIHKLDLFIWEEAAKKLAEWKKEGRDDLHISVNISTKDFQHLDLFATFTNLVRKYGISPQKLKLEITESSMMLDLEKQLLLIDKLQNFGFDIEIDDFGSGYSSLNMLKSIHANVLKLDMGFLRNIKEVDALRAKDILKSTVNLAKVLKMTVITEGVETLDQVEFLTQAGSDYFQGYYFAKPISVGDFEEKFLKQ